MIALAASATPSPLYAVYQAQWKFSPLALTEVYAVYAFGVLASLLVAGGVSDVVGRRPVIITAMIGLLLTLLVFMDAQGLAWLYVARAMQGISTGLLVGAAGAALLDLHPRGDGAHAGMLNGIINTFGMGVGALVSSLLVQWLPADLFAPYVPVSVLLLLTIVIAFRLPETVQRVPGARISFRPPAVPRHLWRIFTLSSLGVIASWSVAGLDMALGPGIVTTMLDTTNHIAGGAFIFVVCGSAGFAQWLLRGASDRASLVAGSLSLAIGSTVTSIANAHGSIAAFAVGTVLVGLGFGAAFMGALRSFTAVLEPGHRASAMSAFFTVAYLAISVPAIGAGLAVSHLGMVDTLAWFGGGVALVAFIVAVVGWFELRPNEPTIYG